MFDIIKNRKTLMPRKGLYCAWIRSGEGGNAPLIRVWIDPSMTMFESRVQVQESDLTAARAEAQAALGNASRS